MDLRNRRSRHALAAIAKCRLALAVTVLCTALAPSPTAGQAIVNAVPSNLPLERYERVVPYRNGCNAIIRLGETAPDSGTRWYGGCRFGLAHGPGIYRMDWTIDGVHSFAASSVDMYYGRWQGAPKPGGSLQPGANPTLSRGVGHDLHEWIVVEDALEAEVQAPNGKSATDLVAIMTQADDVRFTQDAVWVVKNDCPTYGTLEKVLADQYYPLSRAQIAIVAPICRQAINRLKAERGTAAVEQSSPFDNASYGYYFLVYSSRDARPRKGNDYDVYANVGTKNDIQLCPQPTTLTGCEGLWRARQQPIRAKRDALVANYDRFLAADYVSRQATFQPLEDALRAKVQAYALRSAKAAQALVPARTATTRRSKKQ